MNLLLATHVFLWWIDEDRISPLAADAISNPELCERKKLAADAMA